TYNHNYSLHLLFFFLMTPPPPSSTLFPYTTLFRSGFSNHGVDHGHLQHDPRQQRARRRNWQTVVSRRVVWTQRSNGTRLFVRDSDRKSTRLNSSHVAISYAVFCLKKKKRIVHY